MSSHHADQLARLGEHVEASRHEPPPVPRGEEVAPRLIAWLESWDDRTTADLVRARVAFGRAKYGQPLMSDDGRDTSEDLRQELGDALMYAAKAAMQGRRSFLADDIDLARRALGRLIEQPEAFMSTREDRRAALGTCRDAIEAQHAKCPPGGCYHASMHDDEADE